MSAEVMQPADLDDAQVVFPAGVMHLLPPWEEIPPEYRRLGSRGGWANQLVADWFFAGLDKFEPRWRKGIDHDKAMRHLCAILGSWEPMHEHKEAACAYLIASWSAKPAKWTRNRVPA